MVAAAAIGGAFSGAQPTGLRAADVVLCGVLAAVVAAFASRANPWTWVAAAGIAVLASSQSTSMFVLAIGIFAACVISLCLDLERTVAGAVLGGGIVQVLLRLPESPLRDTFGIRSILAAAALLLLVVSGFAHSQSRTRRRVLWASASVFVVALGATALFGVTGLGVRDDIDAGIAATNLGIEAARRGDASSAARQFDRANALLTSSADSLDKPWARVASAVPFVGQNEEALRTLARDASRLTRAGAIAARDADVDSLRVTDGRLDLGRVATMQRPLTRIHSALDAAKRDLADVESGWLVAPVSNNLHELQAKLAKATGSARTASLGVAASARLFGADQTARYLLLFTTPVEARGTGFIGNYGILTVDHGKLALTQFGRASDLNAAPGRTTRTIAGPRDYVARYGTYQPAQDWRKITLSPDFPSVARVASELAPQSGLPAVDGVIAIDPEGIAALLKLTGPITVADRSEPLTAKNAAEFLLRGQYEQFSSPQRVDFLESAARTVTDKLVNSSLPGPRAVGNALGPAVAGGHILLYAHDPTSQRFFQRLGASGTLAPDTGDFVGLTTQNASGNKIELFMQRTLKYVVEVDPESGTEQATATIALANSAPTSGVADVLIKSSTPAVATGANRSIVSFYTTLELQRATLQGQPIELTRQRERGLNVYTTTMTIPSGTTAKLQLDLHGDGRPVAVAGDPAVQLTVGHQAMPNADEVDVRIRTTDGTTLQGLPPLATRQPDQATWNGKLITRLALQAKLPG